MARFWRTSSLLRRSEVTRLVSTPNERGRTTGCSPGVAQAHRTDKAASCLSLIEITFFATDRHPSPRSRSPESYHRRLVDRRPGFRVGKGSSLAHVFGDVAQPGQPHNPFAAPLPPGLIRLEIIIGDQDGLGSGRFARRWALAGSARDPTAPRVADGGG